jgi:chloride channel protein, CIC family
MKLARRGHYMPEALQANAQLVHRVADVKIATAVAVPADTTALELSDAKDVEKPAYFVLTDEKGIAGVVSADRIAAGGDARLASVARRDFIVVPPDTTIFNLMGALQRSAAKLAVVVCPSPVGSSELDLRGVVTRANIVEALAEGMEIFQD